MKLRRKRRKRREGGDDEGEGERAIEVGTQR